MAHYDIVLTFFFRSSFLVDQIRDPNTENDRGGDGSRLQSSEVN